jgi:hypothetical protein
MARQARTRPQNLQERLMPCAQFEALEAHHQEQHDQGVDSDKSTVKDNNNDDNAEEAEKPQGDPALVETRICEDTVNVFKRVLLFSQGGTEALYDNQMITTLDVLRDHINNIIKERCRAIRKPGGDIPGHQISKLSMTCLKFYDYFI